MHNEFVRIPPDSSGKKIRNELRTDIRVININDNVVTKLRNGVSVVGETSGTTGIFLSFSSTLQGFFVTMKSVVGDFTVNENLLADDEILGTIESFNHLYSQVNVIVDSENPRNSQKIDGEGSSYVRFRDGDLLLDGFGNAQFSQSSIMKSYIFTYDGLNDEFWDNEDNGAFLTHSASDSIIRLNTTTQNASKCCRTTLLNFPYAPSQTNSIIIAAAVGDTGKTGVVRRWGLYDDDDGIYFELDGASFSVNIKSSITGTVSSIQQSEFNTNKLLNPVTDLFQLDVSKFNLYWIDYQWQGTGTVRFGVYDDEGSRITLHRLNNSNRNILPYSKRGTLPFRISQQNTQVVASSSELKCSCVVVSRQSHQLRYGGKYQNWRASDPKAVTSDEFTPLFTLRPKTEYEGSVNRSVIIPTSMEFIVQGDPIILDAYFYPQTTGGTFSSYSMFSEVNPDVESIAGGFRYGSLLIPSGHHLRQYEELLNDSIQLHPDGVTQPIVCFAARSIGASSSVTSIFRWKEII